MKGRASPASSRGTEALRCGNPGHDSRFSGMDSWLAQGWLLCWAPHHPLACPEGHSGHSLQRDRPWGKEKPRMSSTALGKRAGFGVRRLECEVRLHHPSISNPKQMTYDSETHQYAGGNDACLVCFPGL